jgi:hypothetical protein
MGIDRSVLAEMQRKVQKELAERERKALEYWKGELEKIYSKRHQNLSTLQLEIKGLIERMENRMRILKKEESSP